MTESKININEYANLAKCDLTLHSSKVADLLENLKKPVISRMKSSLIACRNSRAIHPAIVADSLGFHSKEFLEKDLFLEKLASIINESSLIRKYNDSYRTEISVYIRKVFSNLSDSKATEDAIKRLIYELKEIKSLREEIIAFASVDENFETEDRDKIQRFRNSIEKPIYVLMAYHHSRYFYNNIENMTRAQIDEEVKREVKRIFDFHTWQNSRGCGFYGEDCGEF
jgi:hypothetical protein